MMHRLRLWAATLVSSVYWAAGGAAFLFIGFVVGPLLPKKTGQRLGLSLIRAAFVGFVRLLEVFRIAWCEFIGFERLDHLKGGYLLAPNHPAVWDAVFLMARVGGLTCVLKSSLLRQPLLAGGARIARFIPNDPPSEMVKRSVRALAEGERLLLFPEGTRTRRDQGVLNSFRGGIAIAAKHAGVPVIPVFVQTNHAYGKKGWPLWKAPENTVRIRMTLGDPVLCGADEPTQEFLQRLRAQYIAALSAPPE